MTYRIPFNRPCLQGNELEYIAAAIRSGQISGDGVYTQKCHALLEQELGVAKALLTPSCTHALEMAALLLDIQPGDEVIVPSFTFVSTVNAFVLRGARPVFADIRPDTLNKAFEVCAWSVSPDNSRVIMGIRHKEYPLYGVQFHPESFLTEVGTTLLERFLRMRG